MRAWAFCLRSPGRPRRSSLEANGEGSRYACRSRSIRDPLHSAPLPLPGPFRWSGREQGNMGDAPEDVGRQAVQISNALTKNHREHFGRGAGTVKTVINKGFVVTFLEEIYTPMERTLIEGDREDLVHEARLAFQLIMRDTFVGIVEEATGRKVRAFM